MQSTVAEALSYYSEYYHTCNAERFHQLSFDIG